MKKSNFPLILLLIFILFLGCSGIMLSKNQKNNIQIKDIYIFIDGIEGGPTVSKVIAEFPKEISSVENNNLWKITTAGVERKIKNIYISDKMGNKAAKSAYITFDLETETVKGGFSYIASPFKYNTEIFMNQWVSNYIVNIKGGTLKIENKTFSVADKTKDSINNRIVPDTELFSFRDAISGDYINPITKKTDNLKLHLAAYEPSNLKSGSRKPLIVWLHGQGEGGTDPDIAILGNEASALARAEIQSYFTSGTNNEKGAFVLIVQSPTYWMDEGDGTNGNGSGISRYTQILMKAIENYVATNPYVDRNRIYIGGDSNGGYMTINMILEYPDYFAAAYPICEAYSYYEYEKNVDGTYKRHPENLSGTSNFILTDKLWFTPEKAEKIKNLPIWFINAANDPIVIPKNFSLPKYQALLKAGAKNVWYSYYENVKGTDMPEVEYLGHFSWIHVLNNRVSGVQDTTKIINSVDKETFGFIPSNATNGGSKKAVYNGKTYSNLFAWMNDQIKK